MALRSKSLILYGFEITELNRSLDFRAVMAGPIKAATLDLGFYSLSGLVDAIAAAMNAADAVNTYTATVNRNVAGGLENRVTISTSGAYLDLLFGTGPRIATSIAPLIGFAATDRTGATSYAGSTTCGTALIPDYVGYNYLGPSFQKKLYGAVNISASGLKEAVTFQLQQFVTVEYKFEPNSPPDLPLNTKVISQWDPFFSWAIAQKPFDFTPEVSSPTVAYAVTLEQTDGDGKGLGYKMSEMLPQFPGRYRTGGLKFRLTPGAAQFTG